MSLKSINLSGFKSFVDPTAIQIQGQLVGVVGPNGCGKSNIMDAVRWVLGETRASELRGDTMRDVIFNGADKRSPANRASVELIFNNEDGRFKGQWSEYSEIAVRRIITRDNDATYYINNSVVRRRDIQDMFLGTGLGPRAYAIIGQGMINRIIEARPEDLRIFLEEAAGVSMYRERRKETESRLSKAKDNLVRVADILREIIENIGNLTDQAAVAQKYNEYVEVHDTKQKLYWYMEYVRALEDVSKFSLDVEKAKTKLASINTNLAKQENLIYECEQAKEKADQAVQTEQGKYHAINTEISTLEADQRHFIDQKKKYEQQLNNYTKQREDWIGKEKSYLEECESAENQIAESKEKIEIAQQELDILNEDLPAKEEVLKKAQEACNKEHDAVMQVQHQIDLASRNHKSISEALSGIVARREKFALDKNKMKQEVPDEGVFEELKENKLLKEEQLQIKENELALLQEKMPDLEEARQAVQQKVQALSSSGSEASARLATLLEIQEQSQKPGEIEAWFEKNELNLPPIWKRLHIEKGWERALEAVLGDRIFARELSRLEWVNSFSDLPTARLSFYTTAINEDSFKVLTSEGDLKPFSSLLKIDDSKLKAVVSSWIHGIYIADSLKEALERRSQLPTNSYFILKEGHLIDQSSVRFFAMESEKEGIFTRQQEIDSLSIFVQDNQRELHGVQAALLQKNKEIEECTRQMSVANQDAQTLQRELHAIEMEHVKYVEKRESYRLMTEQIEISLAEIDEEEKEQNQLLIAEEKNLEDLDDLLAKTQNQEELAKNILFEKEAELNAFKNRIRDSENALRDAQFIQTSLRSRIDTLKAQIDMAKEQAAQVLSHMQQGELELRSLDDHLTQEKLNELISARMEQETILAECRNHSEECAQKLRNAREEQMRMNAELAPQYEAIATIESKAAEVRTRAEQYQNHLSQSNADIEQLKALYNPSMKTSSVLGEITRLENQMTALGPINQMAARDLSEKEKQRVELETQDQDIRKGIQNLEEAIKKIDRETRERLQETFDEVNRHLGEIFPELFGGGEAYLEMTGTEILDAGVQIILQPPGKKNLTIQALSGGEKALAAIALVFSLFQLNPAPFCLLDEVDAPLDDANTLRFCKMVKRMSPKTQFLFISHNKLAMEMAQQLIGVTMQEQGVSRIVSVSLEDAEEFSNEVVPA